MDGHTRVLLTNMGVSKASISRWCSESEKNLQLMKTHNLEKENLSLNQENIELRKKIAFLKETTVFFAKEIN